MKAWQLVHPRPIEKDVPALELREVPIPEPGPTQILIRVKCCGICHTELDEIEGRTAPSVLPVILGHQVTGIVERNGTQAHRFECGARVGIAWIGHTCGVCEYCKSGRENLCPQFSATGRDSNGGYAEFMVAEEEFAFSIPPVFSDVEAAPLLCAGAIGYRSVSLTSLRDGDTLGLTGFGASGHLVLKLVRKLFPNTKIIVFARNTEEQKFALSQGADWAGPFTDNKHILAHAIIDTTPVWNTMMNSLLRLRPGGILVVNAIRKENIDHDESLKNLTYENHLWMEKEIKTVANITRSDIENFLAIAASVPIRPEVQLYPFLKANEALHDLKFKKVLGAKVLIMA